jgi:hypothetical protein
LIVDINNNGIFDGMNNSWDSVKKIVGRVNLLYTGEPIVSIGDGAGNVYATTDEIVIPDGGLKRVYFSVHDLYFNSPIAGTSFSVTTSAGNIQGDTDYEFIDTAVPGAPVFYVDIYDSLPGSANLVSVGSLKITVDWKGVERSYSRFVRILNP